MSEYVTQKDREAAAKILEHYDMKEMANQVRAGIRDTNPIVRIVTEHRLCDIAAVYNRINKLEEALNAFKFCSDKFPLGSRVRKKKGPEWVGQVCGYYSTMFTPEGLVIECTADGARGQVHVEPVKKMEKIYE
jgi:hypothetical protein